MAARITWLFCGTLFVSAGLLFAVQPMVAKMLLPLLGGSPSVWNTCMLFYQCVLLAGYAFAHWLSRETTVGRQAAFFAILLLTGTAFLPFALGSGAFVSMPWESSPTPWLLYRLFAFVGLPFFALSVTSPLLQRWYSRTNLPAADNPYFLYAASNAGSLLALLAYPFVLEPLLGVAGQSRAWMYGYWSLIPFVALCGWVAVRKSDNAVVGSSSNLSPHPSPLPRGEGENGDDPGIISCDESPPRLGNDSPSPWGEGGVRGTAAFNTDSIDATPESPPIHCPAHVAPGTASQSLLTSAATKKKVAASNGAPVIRAQWILYAFVPSSLMLGVTHYLATDIASVPLLWVLPLALYMLSFVLVFAERQVLPANFWLRALPIGGIAVVFLLLMQATEPLGMILVAHVTFFFCAAIVGHGRLAALRPEPSRLTEFYLFLSIGGALGGLFNAIIAPQIFNGIWEYPIVLLLACAIGANQREPEAVDAGRDRNLPDTGAPEVHSTAKVVREVSILKKFEPPSRPRFKTTDLIAPALLLAQTWILIHVVGNDLDDRPEIKATVLFGVPLVVCYALSRRPLIFAIALAAVFGMGLLENRRTDELVYVKRNFFGVTRVVADSKAGRYKLFHGRTIHGSQFSTKARWAEPLAYYHYGSPIADVLSGLPDGGGRVGVVGLGAGALAVYARPGERWTFFEIDPAVIEVAKSSKYFTYLNECTQGTVTILEGDARLRLRDNAATGYRLLVIDAFSSDAIPVHLLTREALALYLGKLSPHGVVAFHISNRYLDLEPVLAGLATDAGLLALICRDTSVTKDDVAMGRLGSDWVVMARTAEDLERIAAKPRWRLPVAKPGLPVWTDDFSSILPLVMW